MTRQFQKVEEEFYATKAGEMLRSSWSISSAPDELDWPDLIIQTRDGKFGLEVRNIYKDEILFKGSNLKKMESNNTSFRNKLAALYYTRSAIPISLQILGECSDSHINHIVDFMVQKSRTLDVMSSERCILHELSMVLYIRRLPDHFERYSRWISPGDSTSFVSKFSNSLLIEAIKAKEANLTKYKTNIENVQLLLVLNRSKASGMAELNSLPISLKSSFDQIYVFSYPDKVYVIECV